MLTALKEDDFVLCTVRRIEGTTVFAEIEGFGEGSLVMSEIAAGRIRNLREYVAPNKKIVCKILKIINGHPQLSLRRVTAKEREEVMDKFQKEKTFTSMLKTNVQDYDLKISKIRESQDLSEFIDESKENPKILEKFFSKEESTKLAKLFSEKKEKEKEVKKIFTIRSDSDSGIKEIKSILSIKDAEIAYLGSSKFSLSVKALEFKDANALAIKHLQEIEKKAKELKMFFENN